MEKTITDRVALHLRDKAVFSSLKHDEVELSNTSPKQLHREVINVTTHEFKALIKIFKHIYADLVSEISDTSFWDSLYAFPLVTKCKEVNHPLLEDKSVITHINCKLDIAEKFVKETLQIARDNYRNCFNRKVISDSSKFFIIGDVGTGKTTFLNFIHSHFYDKIYKNGNIFWHTVDLNKQYLRRLNLPEAIKFSAVKFFRAEFYKTLEHDQKEIIRDRIKANFNKSEITDDFNYHYNEFIGIIEKERTIPYHPIVQSVLINYIEEEYGTIYIIDNLDQLSGKDGFNEKLEDVKDIVSDENRKGVFYFVMRKESHLNFLNSYVDIKNAKELARLSNSFKRLEIRPAQLVDIIFKRFDIMLKEWDEIVTDNRSSILDQDEETESEINQKVKDLILKLKDDGIEEKDNLEAYFGIFMIFLLRGIRPENEIDFKNWAIKDSISSLKDLVGTNFRKLMDAIITVHPAFIIAMQGAEAEIPDIINLYTVLLKEKRQFFKRAKDDHQLQLYKKIMKRDYLVIPLLLEGNSHYNHPYAYQFDDDDKKKLNMEEKSYRLYSKFIYSVFYPVNSVNHKQSFNLLLKVRILQYLSRNTIQIYTTNKIVKFIQSKFNYSEHVIRLAINELYKSDIVSIEITSTGYSLRLNRTGKNHLNRLIYDFGYLRIILDDILVPTGYESYFIDPEPEMYESSKRYWIIHQIPRVALFISLISHMEKNDLNGISDKEKEFWEITPAIIDSVTKTIVKICREPDPDLINLEHAFKKHLSKIRYEKKV